MAEKSNPGQPIPCQVGNPYPPQYNGIGGNGPVAPPPVPPNHPVSPSDAQMTPCDEAEDEAGDIYKLTPHVEIAFDDTFKESETARGFSFMKDVNKSIYQYTHFGVYATLSLIVAPFMTIVWGVVFALCHLALVWFIQPAIKNTFIWFRIWSMLVRASVRLFLDPCFQSASLILSSIRGRFSMSDSDVTLNLKTSQVQHV